MCVIVIMSSVRSTVASLSQRLCAVFLFVCQVFEVRNPEDLTEEWLREKLQFFH